MKNLKKIALFASIFSFFATSIVINNLFYSTKKNKKTLLFDIPKPFFKYPVSC